MANLSKYTITINQNSSFAENIAGENFSHQQFTDFSGYDKEIKNCNFSYCLFQRAYFRKVKFISCDFTGAKFFDSNFRDADFENCKFPYAVFKFTIIRSKAVLNNLPEWPNVKIYLLQNHKANANSLGDIKAVRAYLLEEIEANKEHLRRARKATEGYYSQKYKGFLPKLNIYYQSFLIYIDGLIWGHGESPWKIARNILIIILTVSLIQFFSTSSVLTSTSSKILTAIWEYFVADFKAFIGIQTQAISDFSKAILILLRYITLSLYVRILFNKYSWR